ncbi:hypothetical protein DBB42_00080 [Pseudomonas plecoglossicida]|uniref:Uncharacterized protein n=1 Tax=Pseudomonas plecoglossicida TaxID=70775 RepID=A0A2R7USN3_PSEDL|nr:hypothetical protein DBB42_00080 [Pseudomonas plecoglossicida]
MPGLRPLGLLRSPSQASQLLQDHYSLQGKAATVPVGAGSPANTGAAGASHRVGFFAGKPTPTGLCPINGHSLR